jgi:hypothetical protein
MKVPRICLIAYFFDRQRIIGFFRFIHDCRGLKTAAYHTSLKLTVNRRFLSVFRIAFGRLTIRAESTSLFMQVNYDLRRNGETSGADPQNIHDAFVGFPLS